MIMTCMARGGSRGCVMGRLRRQHLRQCLLRNGLLRRQHLRRRRLRRGRLTPTRHVPQMCHSSVYHSPPVVEPHLADEAGPDLLLHEGSCRSPRLCRLHIVGVKAWRLGSARGPRRQALLRRVVARLWWRRIRCARRWRLRIEALLIWRIRAVAPRASGRHGLLRGRVAGRVACRGSSSASGQAMQETSEDCMTAHSQEQQCAAPTHCPARSDAPNSWQRCRPRRRLLASTQLYCRQPAGQQPAQSSPLITWRRRARPWIVCLAHSPWHAEVQRHAVAVLRTSAASDRNRLALLLEPVQVPFLPRPFAASWAPPMRDGLHACGLGAIVRR